MALSQSFVRPQDYALNEEAEKDKVIWAIKSFNDAEDFSSSRLTAATSDIPHFIDIIHEDVVISTIHHSEWYGFRDGWRACLVTIVSQLY